jgi:hypothetical protein
MESLPARADWLAGLAENEDLSIVRGLGSLAFLRAQGRTLEERSQEKVLNLLWDIRLELDSISSRGIFDALHHVWVNRALEILRTNRQSRLAYGQGQKTINVFLKFYVDWASRPTGEVATRLRPWLHCPLDKVVMEAMRSHNVEAWRKRIWDPHYRDRVKHQQRASMSMIDESAYGAWQAWIRELSPTKPVLVDTIWSLLRPMAETDS